MIQHKTTPPDENDYEDISTYLKAYFLWVLEEYRDLLDHGLPYLVTEKKGDLVAAFSNQDDALVYASLTDGQSVTNLTSTQLYKKLIEAKGAEDD